MEEPRVSPEELKRILAADLDRLAEEIVEAMNAAQAGRIIAETEEPVRDAHAVFRQRAYQKALDLLQTKQEAFSPSGERIQEQGQAEHNPPDGQRPDPGA
jgi:hypothetical protein